MKFMTIFGLVLATLLAVEYANAACPNKCSGHGTCGANDVCRCQPNFINGDCSGRLCRFSRTWSADGMDPTAEPHSYVECGGRGKCDRDTGECECDDGYTGAGCRRLACPSQCSGHGVCKFVEDHSTYGTYNGWDREKATVCKCDPGYEGHACQFKMCPKGDDPLTTTDYNMIQYFEATSASKDYYLTYTDPYGNQFNTEKLSTGTIAGASDDTRVCGEIETALRKLPAKALAGVTVSNSVYNVVTRTTNPYTDGTITAGASVTADNGKINCVITFPSGAGTTGLQKILTVTSANHGDVGHQPYLTTTVAASTFATGEAVLSALTSRYLTELLTCSGRGSCDSTTGMCSCYQGHRGVACEKQEALV